MLQAVKSACRYVELGIRTAPNLGKGNGPINHFHEDLKYPLKSTLETDLWEGGSVEDLYKDPGEEVDREVHEVLDEVYDQVLEGREDSPQVGDLFVRTPPRVISKEEEEANREAEEADREAEEAETKAKKAQRAAQKAAKLAAKLAEQEKAQRAAQKAAKLAAKLAEQEVEEDGDEPQELVTEPNRRPNKGLAKKPLRLARKDPTIKRSTAAPKDSATKRATVATTDLVKKPVRRTAKPAQQQTVKEAGEEKGDVEASKDASKKLVEVLKNPKLGAPIPLPSNPVKRSAKAFQQKTAQKAGEKKAGEEDSDDVEVVGEKVVTTQVAGPSKAPAPKPVKRSSKATEQGNLDAGNEQIAGPSQAPAPKPALRLKLVSKRDDLKGADKEADDEVEVVGDNAAATDLAPKKGDKEAREGATNVKQGKRKAAKEAGDEMDVVDVDNYTAAKDRAPKTVDKEAGEGASKVKQGKRKAGDMLPNGVCLFGTSADPPWTPKKVKR